MVSKIIKSMGTHEVALRTYINDLSLEMGFNDQIEYDGDIITREMLDRWRSVLEEMDKVCFFV